MTESAILNIPELIEPISEEKPSGDNIREDSSPTSDYYEIKDIRTQARANERKALEEEDLSFVPGDWKPIIQKSPAILKERTKDIEVCAWLIEALTRTNGFKGLAESFQLTGELMDKFWDDMYPEEDEDGIETKIAPLIGLNGFGSDGALIMPIKCIPLTQGKDFGPFAFWEYNQAYETDGITDPDKKQQKIDNGAITLEMVRQAASDTSPLFFRQLKADMDSAIEAYAGLTEVIDKCCASDPQPTSNIRDTLEKCRTALIDLAGDKLADPEEEAETETDEAASGEEGATSASKKDKSVNNREVALKNLAEIAIFFKKAEPHSPISYALEQCIRWSKMTLPELMSELVQDPGARDSFFKLTGIPSQEN